MTTVVVIAAVAALLLMAYGLQRIRRSTGRGTGGATPSRRAHHLGYLAGSGYVASGFDGGGGGGGDGGGGGGGGC